ncbi:MAG: tyrosine-protein kinase family protein [Candidatus Binataceae bacterium]
MSKYFQAMQRVASTTVVNEPEPPDTEVQVAFIEHADVIGNLAHDPALGRLSEQLAALATGEEPVRLLVSGCRPGDGASTIAAALALDLSQRLAMRTVLVEGHLRHPALRNLLARSAPMPAELTSATSLTSQRTAWPRLELISRPPTEPTKPMLDDLNGLLRRFPIAVIDLGVVRVEPRMLALARSADPVFVVTRYQHTRREELLTTVGVLRTSNHTASGVILNGNNSPVPPFIRRCLGIGG